MIGFRPCFGYLIFGLKKRKTNNETISSLAWIFTGRIQMMKFGKLGKKHFNLQLSKAKAESGAGAGAYEPLFLRPFGPRNSSLDVGGNWDAALSEICQTQNTLLELKAENWTLNIYQITIQVLN